MADSLEDMSSSDDGGTVFPITYIVIRFAPNVKDITLLWFINKIKGRKYDGGAELLIRRQHFNKKEGLILHVSASKTKFLRMAEEMEIVKTDRQGVQREFVISQLEDFLEDGMHVDDFLTMAERQTLVKHELDNIRALSEDESIYGYSNFMLYEGKSILQKLSDVGLIQRVYPLHDYDELKKLGQKWILKLCAEQPLEEIRTYFGESVALYFIFVGYYTTALIFPMVLGFLQSFMSSETLTFFCVFNVLWVIMFLELWKRKCNELAFKWGTITMTSLDEPRANFRGKLGTDPVTGKVLPQSPRLLTNLKMYCVSFPIVFVCLFGGFVIMLWSFWAEDQLKTQFEPDSLLIYIPSVAYTAIVYVVNLFYRQFATFLTEWENHRTQSQYDRHRVIKLVLFEFVNNFMALFYIAFVLQDMEMLRVQLATMLIILQAINHLQEAILPLLLQLFNYKVSKWKESNKKMKRTLSKEHLYENTDALPLVLNEVIPLKYDDARIEQAMSEGMLDDYEGTYDDYLEMFIQFGYVILFSSVYPLAALFAVFNNIVEIRADAFKLCKTCQRPIARRVKDTGAWHRAFEIIGAMSIMTNCGLLWLSPQIRTIGKDMGMTDIEFAFTFVFLEHCLLGIRYVLHQAIPDKPEWVRVALARKNHIAKEALKKERAKKNTKLLTRKYRSVYGTNQAL